MKSQLGAIRSEKACSWIQSSWWECQSMCTDFKYHVM